MLERTGSVTISVPCRVGDTGPWGRHNVVIHSDWSLETPHDLELEMIAAAFGNAVTCVELAKVVLPAVAKMWQFRFRQLKPTLSKERLTSGRCASCRSEVKFAQHLRDPHHWWVSVDASRGLWDAVVAELDLKLLPHRPAGDCWVWPGWGSEPVVSGSYRVQEMLDAGFSRSDNDYWVLGLHPDWILEIHQRLAAPGEILPVLFYLDVILNDVPLDWLLVNFDGAPKSAMIRAARDYTDIDRLDPNRRSYWSNLGFHPSTVKQLAIHDYALADIEEFAAALNEPIREAARILAGWLRAGWKPRIYQLCSAYSLNPGWLTYPSKASVKLLADEIGESELKVALVLATTGSVREARRLLATPGAR